MRVKTPATVDLVIRRVVVNIPLLSPDEIVPRAVEQAATTIQKSRIGFLPT